ncbi:MAG: preprotein translocase subunit SecD [Variovorax sp.]|nr:preprotein translocase subunit SecD [Variovorax sp.]
MRANDILADDRNFGDFNGVTVRKGTVAAFLANAKVWSNPAAGAPERADAERDIVEAVPSLRALGLFEVLDVRDDALRALVGRH